MAVTNVWGITMAPAASTAPRFLQARSCCCDFSRRKKSINPSSFGADLCSISTLDKSSLRKRRIDRDFSCRCSSGDAGSSADWDWNRWSRHFSEIEQAESFASVLKFQLEDAIEKEDFQEAAKLKMAIKEATSNDTVAEIMSQLKGAIEEERYHDALRLRKDTASGLVGWWVGFSKDSDDPFGRLVRITPGVGRLIGRSYSPRQLVTAAPGTPVFEIFVIKDADGTYNMQAVYLQRAKAKVNSAIKSSTSESKAKEDLPASQTENEDKSAVDIPSKEDKTVKSEKGLNIEGVTEEGIKSVIKFLKDRIPGLKVQLMNVDVAEEVTEDSDPVKQLMQEDDEKPTSDESSGDEEGAMDEIRTDEIAFEGEDSTLDNGNNSEMKLFIGGVLQSEDNPTKDDYVRLPAEVKDIEKNSFLLHVPGRSCDKDAEDRVARIKVAALAARGVSELMPSDVAKTFWGVDKVSSKIKKDMREIVKLAVSQAQKRNELSDYTNFSRISTSNGDLDPFDGLYVGAFGPYGTEVVQLRRKFGYWNGSDDMDSSSGVEFFEYVEAVKLTGDLNVPAGQVTFRAKIGKGNRTSGRGLFPDELGVVSSYRGQGRIAEFGFRNPQWVDGELLQLSGRGIGPFIRGADLGFLYVVPEQSFLVLFNRLRLPD